MINERGGINGRKIKFISRDDSSNPRTAVEQTRELVEQERVHLMFGSFGTPSNLATRTYLNERSIPQLFVASGDEEWAHPKRFPWTMGWQPTFRSEGRIYANYIQASYPSRKIAVLWQNDQFGRDLFRGLQEGLGLTANMIVADIAIEADMSIDTQVDILKNSGAEVLVLNCAPPISARAIRRAAELGWHPQLLLVNAAASIANALRPAGLQNSVGVISTSFLKDAGDTTWKEDPADQGLAGVHGQILSRWRQGGWQRHLRLCGGGNAGPGPDPVRRRPVAREHHAAGGVAEELPESGSPCRALRSTPDRPTSTRSSRCGWCSSTATPGSRSAT